MLSPEEWQNFLIFFSAKICVFLPSLLCSFHLGEVRETFYGTVFCKASLLVSGCSSDSLDSAWFYFVVCFLLETVRCHHALVFGSWHRAWPLNIIASHLGRLLVNNSVTVLCDSNLFYLLPFTWWAGEKTL